MKIIGSLVSKAYSVKMNRPSSSHYQMIGDRSREDKVRQAMRVLRAKARRPKAPLFDIGKRSINSVYANAKAEDYDQRRLLEQQTSKYLQDAYLLAENAALGRFPSLDHLPPDPNRPKFNYFALRHQLASYIRLMEPKLAAEKARLAARKPLSKVRLA